MKQGVKGIISILIISSLIGCATGTGVNRNMYFQPNEIIHLPDKVVVDEKTRSIESGIIMGNSFPLLAVTVGLVGAVITSNQGFVDIVRGKFAAGDAFDHSSMKLARDNSEGRDRILFLNLLRFQQYAVPGHLQAFMEFSSHLDNSTDTYLSAYSCDFTIKGAMFTPSTEKDMLSEMIDSTLFHWGKTLLSKTTSDKDNMTFPSTERGKLLADGVECTYELFVKK